MKRITSTLGPFLLAGFLIVALVATSSTAIATVPTLVPVQGRLATAGNSAVPDGTYVLAFSLYPSVDAEVALWKEIHLQAQVINGIFSIQLGAVAGGSPLPTSALIDGDEVWIGVSVGSEPELPRQRMLSAPYALVAGHATYAEMAGKLVKPIGPSDIEDASIPGSKVDFTYAGSSSKGGAATSAEALQCTGCVTTAMLAASAVTATRLAAAAVGSAALANGAVLTIKLADGAVTTVKIAPGAVGAAQLAAGSVSEAALAAGSVTETTIADGAVSAAKLAKGLIADVGHTGAYADLVGLPNLAAKADRAGGNTFSGAQNFNDPLTFAAPTDFSAQEAKRFRLQNATKAPVACDGAAAGVLYFNTTSKQVLLCDGSTYVPVYQAPIGTSQNPGLSCKHILTTGDAKGTGTYYVDADGGGTKYGSVQVTCDMVTDGGGWTLVYANSMATNLDGIKFTRTGSQCGNNIHKNTSSGWWMGHGNGGNGLSVAGMGSVELTLELTNPVVVLDGSEIRHKGVFQNHSGYDWSGASSLISSSPFKGDGELGSQVWDGQAWSWFVFYRSGGVQAHDLARKQTVKSPYIRWGYQYGGPNHCDVGNSDGGYLRDWEVWVR